MRQDHCKNTLVVTAGDLRVEADHSDNVAVHTALTAQLGDLNTDGVVDFTDFLLLSSNFEKSEAGPSDGDLDGDGRVEFSDYLLLAANFGKSP